MHRQHVDGVLVELDLGHRRVVAGLAQQLEVRDERRHAVVLGHVAVALHHVEEARDVLDLRLRLGGGLLREPPEQARPLQEAVEHLARAPARHLGGGALQVRDQAGRSLAGAARDRGELLVPRQLAQQLEQRPRLAPRVVVEAQQVRLGDGVELRRAEVEERHRVVGVREHLQERDQQPDLLARVEPAAAAEAVRHAAHVERAQEGIGVGVAAHQDREVPRTQPLRAAAPRRAPRPRRPRPTRCRTPGAGRPGRRRATSAAACRSRRSPRAGAGCCSR